MNFGWCGLSSFRDFAHFSFVFKTVKISLSNHELYIVHGLKEKFGKN